jgi:site-specific DNA-methyltransferase (adenine-specific)
VNRQWHEKKQLSQVAIKKMSERTSMGKRTKTSKFGVSKREGHDSTTFYSGKLYQDLKINEDQPEVENTIPQDILDKVLCQDSRRMAIIPDSSVHLMVTSPPYNVGKEYDEDLDLDQYLSLLKDVFTETYRVLVNGGRACINIANVGRKPYVPYHKFIIDVMTQVGFLMRGEIVWNKGASAGSSTAWGSWCSPANPTLRDTHEYILVFSKGKFGRQGKWRQPTISKEEFLEYTKSVWEFQPESAEKVDHPAPFPVELPYRCIQLYTFQGDVVLDPFCGVGTACVAAIKAGRHFVGIDISQEYVEKAIQRIELLGQRNRLKQLLSTQFQLSEPGHRKQIGHPKRQANQGIERKAKPQNPKQHQSSSSTSDRS